MKAKSRKKDLYSKKEPLINSEIESNSEIEKKIEICTNLLFKWQQENEKSKKTALRYLKNIQLTTEEKKINELQKKIKECDLKYNILKNGIACIDQDKKIIFHFIKNNEKIYPLTKMCEILGVNNSTYYIWKSQKISESKKKKRLMQEKIAFIYFESKKRYGCPRITAELHHQGYKISSATVARYMKELGLFIKVTKN